MLGRSSEEGGQLEGLGGDLGEISTGAEPVRRVPWGQKDRKLLWEAWLWPSWDSYSLTLVICMGWAGRMHGPRADLFPPQSSEQVISDMMERVHVRAGATWVYMWPALRSFMVHPFLWEMLFSSAGAC